jgi:uncharacterized cupredoxin-like copper-binding protein
LFKTLAIAFVLVLVGVACTEVASGDAQGIDPGGNTEFAAEAPSTDGNADVIEEAHAEDDDHGTEEAATAEAADATEPGRIVEVTMSEFAFDPGSLDVAAGETITFVVTNAGVVEHEFRLSNEHRIEEHKASGHAGHSEQGEDGQNEDEDVVLLLPAGESGEITVTFPDDTTVFTQIACLIPGHHEAGMGGAIEYTA